MLKQIILIGLVGLVINLSFSSTALANPTKDAKFAEKVKTNIVKLGVGQDARVKVKLKDGTKLKGHVSQVDETSFFVTNETNGETTEVSYQQVKQVKGNNLSTGVKIAISFAVLFLILALPMILSKDGV